MSECNDATPAVSTQDQLAANATLTQDGLRALFSDKIEREIESHHREMNDQVVRATKKARDAIALILTHVGSLSHMPVEEDEAMRDRIEVLMRTADADASEASRCNWRATLVADEMSDAMRKVFCENRGEQQRVTTQLQEVKTRIQIFLKVRSAVAE